MLDLIVAIDTSASIGEEELKAFASEIIKIKKAQTKIHIVECDATIQRSYDLKRELKPEFKGRGGTDFRYIIIISSMALIAASILLSVPLYYGLFSSVLLSVILYRVQGYTLWELKDIIIQGVKECTSVYIIVILIGGIISMWIASGIVPSIIYYGFNYIKGPNFLVTCFLISLVIGISMGTPIGTISTIGIALLAIGRGLSIPVPMILGAIISGAFIADKTSPIASLVNLTMRTIDIKYKKYIKYLLVTQVPLIVIGIVSYYIMGKGYGTEIQPIQLQAYQESIYNNFNISPLLLLFPILIIVMAVLGVKIITTMTIGLLGSGAVSLFLQKITIVNILEIILLGYKSDSGIKELDAILKGGGMLPMLEVILVIIGAVALSSLFEGTNMIKPIISSFTNRVRNKGTLILKTSILSNLLTIVTCDQTVGILILGKMLRSKYEEINLNRSILARTITDSGTTIAPLIPWNSNSIIIVAITGIGAVEYAPYALLCYLSPLVTIIYGYFRSGRFAEKM